MIKLDKNGLTAPSITTGSITMDDTSVESFNQFVIKNIDGVIEDGINVDTGILISGNINSKLSDENKNLDIGWKYNEREGAVLSLSSIEETDNPGGFNLISRNANKSCTLKGTTSGNLTWNDCLLFETPYNSTSWNGICVAALGNHSDFSIGFEAKHGGVLQFNHTNARTDDENGAFYLSASDSSGNLKSLCGKKDGTLTWDGSKVITNSSLTDLENDLYFADNSSNRGVGYKGLEGARIAFYSANNSNDADKGRFAIAAIGEDSAHSKYLVGKPDGTFTWNGSNIVTYAVLNRLDSAIVWTTDNSRTSGSLGFSSSNGARLIFYNKNHTTWTGVFQLAADDGSTSISLVGKPDGSLTWNGVNLKVPTGTIIALAKSTSTPSGYLHCSGAEVSKTTYADLYALIRNTFGTPTDNTKFKLPNLYNKVLWGGAISSDSTYIAGTYNGAGLPNISGAITSRKAASTTPYAGGITGASGAFKFTSGAASGASAGLTATGSTYGADTVNFAASNSNSIYGASSTVRPPSLNVLFYIKY